MKLSARSIIITVAAVLGISGLVLIAACAPSTSPIIDAQQGLNAAQARATNAALQDQDMRNATAQANQRATDAAGRATDMARSATEQAANATQAAIVATEQAGQRIIAAAAQQLSLDQARVAATATRAALDRQMSIDAQAAQRTAAEAQATITKAQADAAEIAQSVNMRSDWYWTAPQVLMQYAPCALVIVGILLVTYVVRAIAARIAGDKDRAGIALSNPSLTIYFPTLSRPPPTPYGGG